MCHNFEFRTQRRKYLKGKATPKDGVNAGCRQVNGWIGLNPETCAEGSYPNCEVPDA